MPHPSPGLAIAVGILVLLGLMLTALAVEEIRRYHQRQRTRETAAELRRRYLPPR